MSHLVTCHRPGCDFRTASYNQDEYFIDSNDAAGRIWCHQCARKILSEVQS